MFKPIVVFLVSVLSWLGFEPPEIVTVREYIFVPKLVEVVREVESTVYVWKFVEVEPEFREFESLEELEMWRDDRLVYINDKPYLFGINDYSPKRDCDDVAETWQRQALDDGYLMSVCIIKQGWIRSKRVSKARGWHMACLTMIGNDVYVIDTYPPYKITQIGIRDMEVKTYRSHPSSGGNDDGKHLGWEKGKGHNK